MLHWLEECPSSRSNSSRTERRSSRAAVQWGVARRAGELGPTSGHENLVRPKWVPANRTTEEREEVFIPTRQVHGLCSQSTYVRGVKVTLELSSGGDRRQGVRSGGLTRQDDVRTCRPPWQSWLPKKIFKWTKVHHRKITVNTSVHLGHCRTKINAPS